MSFTYKDNSAEVKAALENAISTALEICGAKCENYAKALAPVDTGNLRNSINHRVDGNTAIVGTETRYAVYQEMGTYKMQAANGGAGYMRPAVLEHYEEYENVIRSELAKTLQ